MKRFLLFFLAGFLLAGTGLQAQVKWKIPKSYRKKPMDKKGNIVDLRIDFVQGKWQEVSRIPVGGNAPISYTDTMFITVTDREAVVKQGNQMTMKGDAKVQDKMFTAAADLFEIVNLRTDEMTLKDEDNVRKMKRMDSYYFEGFGKDSVHTEQFVESADFPVQQFYGTWTIYRKKAEPGKATLSPVLEIIKIDRIDGINGTGTVTFHKGASSETADATFEFGNRQLKIVSPSATWQLDTYKADGKELVLGEKENILYFAIK